MRHSDENSSPPLDYLKNIAAAVVPAVSAATSTFETALAF
jgi:hypothetical protein